MAETTLLQLAEQIARKAHAGQVDIAGRPYDTHPQFVASLVKSEKAKIVAWLHDVLEDTDTTAEELLSQGIPPDCIEAVLLMTHADDIPYDDYVKNLAHNALAREVKLADLTHNLDASRLQTITPADEERFRKYRRNHRYLREYKDHHR